MATRFTLPREQPLSDVGITLPGAKGYFYISGTSTPQDTYSDNALTTPNTNPLIADSAGRFGDCFLIDADYKFILKDTNDVTIYTADPVRGPAGASEASQAEVDARTATDKYVSPAKLATGTGLQGASIASAAALTIPAIGDYFNVTGTTTITSISTRTAGREVTLLFAGVLTLTHNASSLILPNGADILTAAGDTIDFRSEGSGNWRMVGAVHRAGATELLQILTASSSATLVFTAFAPTKYSRYRFEFDNIAPATDGAVFDARVSIDAGVGYRSTAGDYTYAGRVEYENASAAAIVSTGATAAVISGQGVGNATNEKFSGVLELIAPEAGNVVFMQSSGALVEVGGNLGSIYMSNRFKGTTDDVDGIQFLFSTGNIASGSIRCYGIRR